MKIKWLGQAGLLFETEKMTVLVDPYLSDYCHKKNPSSYRRTKLDTSYLSLKPDVIVLTHDHADHTDPDTLEAFLTKDSGITVLASRSAWQTARKFGGNNNYVLFDVGTEWTQGNLVFEAVKAYHSDEYAVGVIISDEKKKYYVTGDTLYNVNIFESLPCDIDTVFLPINGKGNNMNSVDAARFAEKTGALHSFPLHYGMFDELTHEIYQSKTKITSKPYEYIDLEVKK